MNDRLAPRGQWCDCGDQTSKREQKHLEGRVGFIRGGDLPFGWSLLQHRMTYFIVQVYLFTVCAAWPSLCGCVHTHVETRHWCWITPVMTLCFVVFCVCIVRMYVNAGEYDMSKCVGVLCMHT